jgi:hypothetical protein
LSAFSLFQTVHSPTLARKGFKIIELQSIMPMSARQKPGNFLSGRGLEPREVMLQRHLPRSFCPETIAAA